MVARDRIDRATPLWRHGVDREAYLIAGSTLKLLVFKPIHCRMWTDIEPCPAKFAFFLNPKVAEFVRLNRKLAEFGRSAKSHKLLPQSR
jgi:hypothetical protein